MIKELSQKEFSIIEGMFPDVFSNSKVETELKNNSFRKFYTVSVDKNIIGFISFDIIYERAELININIKKEYENNGYGSALLSFLFEYLKSKNIESITLEVRINNYNAIHLYEKFGFIKVGCRKKYYNGIDAILMERKMM